MTTDHEDDSTTQDDFDWTNPDAVMSRLTENGQFADEADTSDVETTDSQSDESEGKESKADESAADDSAEAQSENARQSDDTDDGDSSDDETPRGVQTKNKGRIIPYQVLEETRADVQHYKQQASDLQEQLEALQKHQESEGSQADDDELKRVMARLDADEEFPDEGDVVKALKHAVKQSEDATRRVAEQQRTIDQQRQQQKEAAEQAAADEALADHNEAIKDTPQLQRFWDAGGPLKQQAEEISTRMLNDESYSPASRAEHYVDVEKELCELLGIDRKPKSEPKSDEQKSEKSEQKKAARKSLPELESPEPASLSDIPGGAAPETTEAEAFMDMPGMKGVAQLTKMSDSQQQEFIRRAFGG